MNYYCFGTLQNKLDCLKDERLNYFGKQKPLSATNQTRALLLDSVYGLRMLDVF